MPSSSLSGKAIIIIIIIMKHQRCEPSALLATVGVKIKFPQGSDKAADKPVRLKSR